MMWLIAVLLALLIAAVVWVGLLVWSRGDAIREELSAAHRAEQFLLSSLLEEQKKTTQELQPTANHHRAIAARELDARLEAKTPYIMP